MTEMKHSQSSTSEVLEIHPVDITLRQGLEDCGTYCVEIVRNAARHPVLVISHIPSPGAKPVRVTRIPFNSILKYFARHAGCPQRFRCFDDADPPQALPFQITQIRERGSPMARVVPDDRWATRSCHH